MSMFEIDFAAMSTMLEAPPETELTSEDLRPILESHCFDRAETQKKVLIYLWEQRGKEISEYAIAIDALGRRADFDPKIDASVRVQVSRLRRKLKDFYETEGRNCPLKLRIPIGSHSLEVVEPAFAPTPAPVPYVPPASTSPRWLLLTVAGACVFFAVLSIWLLSSRMAAVHMSNQRQAEPPIRFWSDFLGGAKKTQIVLPTPVFLEYPAKKGLRVRDIFMNDFQNWRSSPDLVAVSKYAGDPHIEQSYTVTTDTFAAITLARYLDAAGLGSTVVFSNNSNTSMNDLESSSEIAFGTEGSLQPFQFYLDRMRFFLTANESSVETRITSPSEPKKIYKAVDEGNSHAVLPGIIAVLPGKKTNTKLLILQSRHTAALVEMLTSTTGSELIEKLRSQHGSPTYYEIAVLTEMNGDHMIRAWPVDFHPATAANFTP